MSVIFYLLPIHSRINSSGIFLFSYKCFTFVINSAVFETGCLDVKQDSLNISPRALFHR